MLPKVHIILGAVFSILIWFLLPQIPLYCIVLIFLSSFLIDFDHYMCAVLKNKSLSLPKALQYYCAINKTEEREFKAGIKRKGNFHVFHTVEFHLLVLALGFISELFFFIFIGMTFHSLIDIADMSFKGRLYRREFFFVNWLIKRLNKADKSLR